MQIRAMNGIEEQKAYWLSEFSEPPPPPRLPWDKEIPPVSSYVRETFSTQIPPETWCGVKNLAKRAGTSPHAALLAALKLLLFRYTGQTDFIIGAVLDTASSP